MWMLELTVPTNSPTGLNQARMRKQSKPEYNCVVTDLVSVGWQVNYNTIKIDSLGHFAQDTLDAVITFYHIRTHQ